MKLKRELRAVKSCLFYYFVWKFGSKREFCWAIALSVLEIFTFEIKDLTGKFQETLTKEAILKSTQSLTFCFIKLVLKVKTRIVHF